MENKVLQTCETCGGTLIYAADKKSAVCSFCGNEYFFKEEKSEALTLALNRANALRLRNDFDGAIAEYKLVAERNPDDAEAFWGLALSTYGIEYVEDPRTRKRVPTCRRTVKKSILEDENYIKALENAPAEQREIYERRAAVIDRLQKSIKRRLEDEEDFDVFISFKSTDEEGKPTKERGVARRIYDELERRGIKTFFSEVTLRDRIGEDFEPIIFKALYSCKFFILVAASEENMNSAWVKNEWSRYRDRVFDENLSGAGCAVFEGMSPNALPAFLRTQGINLAKYPAGGYEIEIADALAAKFGLTHKNDEAEEIRRQIEEQKKAFEEQQRALEERLKNVAATAAPATGASATVNTLLKRARQESESGDYGAAQNYYNKVLDADPENAEAWLGLYYAANRVKDAAGILRTADSKLAETGATLQECGSRVSANEQYVGGLLGGKYFSNAEKYASANTREEIQNLRTSVSELLKKKNAAIAERKAEIEEELRIQEECRLQQEEEKKRRAEEERRHKAEMKKRRAEEKRRQEEERLARERRRKRKKMIAITSCVAAVAVAVAGFFAVQFLIVNPNRYEKAKNTLAVGDYQQAVALFKNLGGYKDSEQLLKESYYGLAGEYESEGETYLAATTYGKAAGYSDAWEKSYALWANFVPKETWFVNTESNQLIYLEENGKISCTSLDSSSSETVEENWEGVVSISQAWMSDNTILALTEDGRILTNSEFHEKKVADWENIVQLTCVGNDVFALKADGTVKTTAAKRQGCGEKLDVSKWKDIRMISYSGAYIVGLKADGSTVFSGFNGNDENNLAADQYEAVFAIGGGVIARKEDGSVNLSGALLRNSDPAACTDFICASGHDYGIRSEGTAVYFNVGSLIDEPQVIEGYDFVSVSNDFGLTRGGEVYEFSIEGYTGHYYIGVEKACTLSGVRLPSYPWAD